MVVMKKIYCITCNKYRKFETPKILYIFDKTLVLSIICDNCGSNDENIIKEEESIEVLKYLGLINNMKVMYCTNKYKITLKRKHG